MSDDTSTMAGSDGGGDSDMPGLGSFQNDGNENGRPDADTSVDGSGGAPAPTETVTPLEAQERWPERATSELAAEPEPYPDAERLEGALREAGPLADKDAVYEARRRAAETAPGGTSLT
jgi:hypothetical protein